MIAAVVVQQCRYCGCTDLHGCPEGCWWVRPGVCSQCVHRDQVATDITLAVRKHCNDIGCTPSNTQAAIAWALRSSASLVRAVHEGRRRARQLRERQPAVAR